MDKFEELVRDERISQDTKWGEQNHHPAIWLAILMEEVGEVSSPIIGQEWRPDLQTVHELEHELVQVAAVAKVMWESGKRNGWL